MPRVLSLYFHRRSKQIDINPEAYDGASLRVSDAGADYGYNWIGHTGQTAAHVLMAVRVFCLDSEGC